MDKGEIKKYLGMAIHFTYHFYKDLAEEDKEYKNRFYKSLCHAIATKLGDESENFKRYLIYGINNFEEVYPILEETGMPEFSGYSKEEILIFFKMFYEKIVECERLK